jgi:hypothetical protein
MTAITPAYLSQRPSHAIQLYLDRFSRLVPSVRPSADRICENMLIPVPTPWYATELGVSALVWPPILYNSRQKKQFILLIGLNCDIREVKMQLSGAEGLVM